MGADILAWLNLGVRWLHVIAGIAWIGSSFYFMWLDARLKADETTPKGVQGDLWAVHGGGFYHKRKYLLAPPDLPEELHWFKWEAYTTWLSGSALLALIYYLGAQTYLIDASKMDLAPWQAIAIGLGFLAGGWILYDALCRSPLGQRLKLFGVVWFLILTAAAWALSHIFSNRGAFIHLGALIGTVMVANVFLVIIPNQKKIVAAMLAGETPDPALGKRGKMRSVHNNYMTLPVLFLMVSNHYPMVIDHPLNWLLVAGIGLSGVTIRHFFNRRNAGFSEPMILAGGVLIFLLVMMLALATRPKPADIAGVVPFTEVRAIVQKHCVACHSARPTNPGFATAPNGVAYDTPAEIRRYAPRIYERAVATDSMPLGNETGMTKLERDRLGAWIRAQAK
ncbi:MAG: urate hydroxylase PuuD [Caulobacterales bacterium]|nr:urate hydroxylase PuuD [Caulobacterales bacterium]